MEYIHKCYLTKKINKMAIKLYNYDNENFKNELNKIYNQLSVKDFFGFIYCFVNKEKSINYFINNKNDEYEYLINFLYENEVLSNVNHAFPEKYYLNGFPLVKFANLLSYDKRLILANYLFENGTDFEKILVVSCFEMVSSDKQEFIDRIKNLNNAELNALLCVFSQDIDIVSFYKEIVGESNGLTKKRIVGLIKAYYGLNELYCESYAKYGLKHTRFKDATDKRLVRKELKNISEEYFAKKEEYDKRYIEGIEKHF